MNRLSPLMITDSQESDQNAEIRHIVHGQVSLDLPSIAGFGVATATAAMAGLRPAMKVFAQADASGSSGAYNIQGARCTTDDVLEVTLGNCHSAANNPTAVNINAFAIR